MPTTTEENFVTAFKYALEQGFIEFGLVNFKGWLKDCDCAGCRSQRIVFGYLFPALNDSGLSIAHHKEDLPMNESSIPKVQWFGKDCNYQTCQWEHDNTQKTGKPVLIFCKHTDNSEDCEGNCRPGICPLIKQAAQHIRMW